MPDWAALQFLRSVLWFLRILIIFWKTATTKRIVSEEIVSRFDHALVLRASESGEEFFRVLAERFGNVVTVGYQPTCENMLSDFAARIAARLPEGVALHSLRLHETATSFAEWFAEDNM